MTYMFNVEGKPQGKQRPKFNSRTRTAYTPKPTKDYEKAIAWAYKSAKGKLISGAVEVRIKAYFRPNKKLRSLTDDDISKTFGALRYVSKPDVDNIAKAVLDGLNGVAYNDDAQVVNLAVGKEYALDERIEVAVREVY